MPMTPGNFVLPIAAFFPPGSAGQFVMVTEIAGFHKIVDAHASIAVVIVVGLPERAEGINGDFVRVAEIMGEDFDAGAIGIATEGHAVLVRVAVIFHDIAGGIDDGVAVLVPELSARIAEIEIAASRPGRK